MMINPHPGLPEFDYIQPGSLVEASQFLAGHPIDARPFSGGTDCFVRMRDGFISPKFMVDIKGLDGTRDLSYDPHNGLTVGAAISMNQTAAFPAVVEHYPLLAQAIQTVASYSLRTRATVAGNLCNASPAGDTAGACLVFGGALTVHGVNGLRTAPLDGFFKGPGRTVLEPGDIVIAVHLPVPPAGAVGRFIKLGRNKIGDLSIVAVTVLAHPDAGALSGFRFRLALASVAPMPIIPTQAEAILAGRAIDANAIDEAAEAAMEAARPIDDVRGSARYRSLMVRNLTRQALTDVWNQLH